MSSLQKLLDNNLAWAQSIEREKPGFFSQLAAQQSPELLWIGSSDSRVPANQIIDVLPGEVFVHRNLGNIVAHNDINCLSVLQYAIEVLKVKHVIVCGHYGCGAVNAALNNSSFGLIDNWLRNIKDIFNQYEARFQGLTTDQERSDLLCELNVIKQVSSVCHTSIVQDAWERGQKLAVHGWIYCISDGLLQDLEVTIDRPESLPDIFRISKLK